MGWGGGGGVTLPNLHDIFPRIPHIFRLTNIFLPSHEFGTTQNHTSEKGDDELLGNIALLIGNSCSSFAAHHTLPALAFIWL